MNHSSLNMGTIENTIWNSDYIKYLYVDFARKYLSMLYTQIIWYPCISKKKHWWNNVMIYKHGSYG